MLNVEDFGGIDESDALQGIYWNAEDNRYFLHCETPDRDCLLLDEAESLLAYLSAKLPLLRRLSSAKTYLEVAA